MEFYEDITPAEKTNAYFFLLHPLRYEFNQKLLLPNNQVKSSTYFLLRSFFSPPANAKEVTVPSAPSLPSRLATPFRRHDPKYVTRLVKNFPNIQNARLKETFLPYRLSCRSKNRPRASVIQNACFSSLFSAVLVSYRLFVLFPLISFSVLFSPRGRLCIYIYYFI